jgi:chloramphenicol-sensitive protein RarD
MAASVIEDPTPGADAAASTRSGVSAALLAYGLWGFLPILFHALGNVSSFGIVAYRTTFSLVLVGLILAIAGKFGEVRMVLADGQKMRRIGLSAVLLAVNWLIYVWAVETGNVLEASFGYFINPLVNIAIGMVMLGERQNRMQTMAIAIAIVAIAIQAVGIGHIPYIALSLAFSFGFYGYFRKTVKATSTTGLFAETLVIAPVALGYIVYSFATGGGAPLGDPLTLLLLILTGPATAVPLLLFAYAVQRLRLTTIGMFQYIAPSIQFLLAITYFGEELNSMRLLSFGLIWLSLLVFSYDSYRRRPGKVAA